MVNKRCELFLGLFRVLKKGYEEVYVFVVKLKVFFEGEELVKIFEMFDWV